MGGKTRKKKVALFLVMVFGQHLTIDLSGCNSQKLKDLELHHDLLANTPHLIGMTPITQPYVFKYSGLVPQDRGITGSVIIAESHISIHSFELKNYCFVDVFSCKPFDTKRATEIFVEAFEPIKYMVNVVDRGIDFPR